MVWQRLKRLVYERLIRPILFVQDTPRSKAGGVALGVFIAFLPIVGVQMPISFGLATLFGVSQPLAVAMAWLTNPVTVPPVYYFEYRVGAWMLDAQAIGSRDDFWRHWEAVSAKFPSYWDRVLHLASDVGFPLFLGSLPVAVILAVISYPLTFWLCTRRQQKVEAHTLHPVGGDILPEPAHDPLPGSETKVLRLDDVQRPRDELGERRGDRPMGPTSGVGVLLLAVTTALATQGCAEPRDRYTTRGEQAESRTEGSLPLFWRWCDEQTLAVVAPYHAAMARDRRLQEQVQRETGSVAPRRCLALTLFRFGEPAAFTVAKDGITVEGEAGAGSFRSLAPSEVLRGVGSAAEAGVLGAQLGAAGVAPLKSGQLVRLLLVLPGELDFATVTRLALKNGAETLPLASAQVGAVRWDEFRSQPSRAGFEQLLGPSSTDRGPLGAESTAGEKRDDGDGTGGK